MEKKIGAVQASAMLLAEIFIGLKFHPSLPVCIGLFAAGLAGGIFFYQRGKEFVLDQREKKLSRVFFYIAILAAGLIRVSFSSTEHSPAAIEKFAGQRVDGLTGYIIAPPVTTPSRTSLRVQLDKTQLHEKLPNDGRILLIFYDDPGLDYQYGNRLSINGKIVLPPDAGNGFSYREYLARSGITAMINNPDVSLLPGFSGEPLKAAVYRLRKTLVDQVFRLFPGQEGALMAGILLGDESKITSDVDRAFQKTGTAHIIAISGANFTLLTWILLHIIRRLIPHWWAPFLMIPFIWFYTDLVGGNSAVVRAAFMCGLSIVGLSIGRRGNGINNLALTCAVMALWNPLVIYDLGFQLSATATLGILLFSEPLCNIVRKIISKLLPNISEEALTSVVTIMNDLCLMSFSAQVYTLWVSAQAFGRISLIAPLANFLIAPFQSLIMIGGFVVLLLSFIFYPFGAAAAWLVWAAPALTIRIVQQCAAVRWGTVYFELSSFQSWLIIGLITVLWAGRYAFVNSFRKRMYQPYAALLLLFLAVMIWVNVFDRFKHQTEIEFHQTVSSMNLSVTSPENRLFIIGDNLTNYSAQDLLEKKIFPVSCSPAAAWIDIPEAWMKREFLKSDKAAGLSVLYLNGELANEAVFAPDELEEETAFTMDGIVLRYVKSYLNKRAWIVEDRNYTILFPNGIPPKRLFTDFTPDMGNLSLAVLGKRDDKSLWAEFSEQNNNRLQIEDFSEKGDVTIILSREGMFYR